MPPSVNMVIDSLHAKGFEAYAVGGCVRDTILAREPDDWDITTSASPQQVKEIFDRTVDKNLLVRRMYIVANHVVTEAQAKKESEYEQLDFFTDAKKNEEEENNLKKEKDMQNAIVKIKQKYGKNAIIKGMNLEEGATALERNRQIGGHKA